MEVEFMTADTALPPCMPLPFSLFLPAYPRRAIRAVFGPVGLRREHGPTLDAAFHLVPALADLGVQGRICLLYTSRCV